MPNLSWISGARLLAAACSLVCIDVQAQTAAPLLQDVHTVAAATQGVPVEETFTITTAGSYQITLTDFGAQQATPAPLASAKLAITNGATVVGTPLVATPGASSWSTTISAQPGTYVIHVVGVPSTTKDPDTGQTVIAPGSGPIGLSVTNTANNSQVASFADAIAFPPGASLPSGSGPVGTLNDSFTVTTSGSYVVTVTDMQLPAALASGQLTLVLVVQGGDLVTSLTSGPTAGNPLTATVALQAGTTYRIAGGGMAGTANAGLWGVNISPAGGGAAVYSNTVPVGNVAAVGTPTLTATTTNYTLTVADLSVPTPLAQVGAVVTQYGQAVTQLTAAGTTTPFIADAAPYQVFAFGVPATGGSGSYTVSLQPTVGPTVLTVSRAVTDPTSGAFVYSYDTPVDAATYSFDLADFGYPNNFASVQWAAVQAGALLPSGTGANQVTSLTGSGTLTITPASGTVTLLVFATPTPAATPTSIPGGLFGIDLIETGAGAPAFETSQGVGQIFTAKKVTIPSNGQYQVTLNDVGFPANFANLAVVVTRGTSRIGSAFGGGTFPFAAVAGDYIMNFVAQPMGTDLAGTYSLVVGESTPSSATLQPISPSSVNSGATVTLTWTSTNTTACTASSSPAGVWSGTIATSGTATSAAITATTTFTITCTGGDGATPTSMQTVTLASSSSSSSGGSGGGGHGGSISTDLIAFLLGLLALRVFRDRSRLQ